MCLPWLIAFVRLVGDYGYAGHYLCGLKMPQSRLQLS